MRYNDTADVMAAAGPFIVLAGADGTILLDKPILWDCGLASWAMDRGWIERGEIDRDHTFCPLALRRFNSVEWSN